MRYRIQEAPRRRGAGRVLLLCFALFSCATRRPAIYLADNSQPGVVVLQLARWPAAHSMIAFKPELLMSVFSDGLVVRRTIGHDGVGDSYKSEHIPVQDMYRSLANLYESMQAFGGLRGQIEPSGRAPEYHLAILFLDRSEIISYSPALQVAPSIDNGCTITSEYNSAWLQVCLQLEKFGIQRDLLGLRM